MPRGEQEGLEGEQENMTMRASSKEERGQGAPAVSRPRQGREQR